MQLTADTVVRTKSLEWSYRDTILREILLNLSRDEYILKIVSFYLYRLSVVLYVANMTILKFSDGDGPNLCRVKSRC